MPRLKCTFKDFVAILEQNGFVLIRHDGSSHRRYRGMIGGSVRLVDVAAHRWTDEILPETLASMIRQSGLSKKLFRK